MRVALSCTTKTTCGQGVRGRPFLPFDIEKFASEIVAKTKLKSEKTCLANGWAAQKKNAKD